MIGLLVALAGGLGAVTRFVVDAQVARRSAAAGRPLGTMFINITGSFLLGLVTGWWAAHTGDPGLKQVLGTGFLGGYTTFSTACVEAVRLLRAERGWSVLFHTGGTLVLAVAAALAGFGLGGL
ncbi:MAG: CrcB family protein [Micropruina sp.]|nr:MAG: CrcB family protein [Micropruina sp.]